MVSRPRANLNQMGWLVTHTCVATLADNQNLPPTTPGNRHIASRNAARRHCDAPTPMQHQAAMQPCVRIRPAQSIAHQRGSATKRLEHMARRAAKTRWAHEAKQLYATTTGRFELSIGFDSLALLSENDGNRMEAC